MGSGQMHAIQECQVDADVIALKKVCREEIIAGHLEHVKLRWVAQVPIDTELRVYGDRISLDQGKTTTRFSSNFQIPFWLHLKMKGLQKLQVMTARGLYEPDIDRGRRCLLLLCEPTHFSAFPHKVRGRIFTMIR